MMEKMLQKIHAETIDGQKYGQIDLIMIDDNLT